MDYKVFEPSNLTHIHDYYIMLGGRNCGKTFKEIMNMKNKQHQYCLRCGRKLKKEEAKKLGYGPTCWKKMQKSKHKLF